VGREGGERWGGEGGKKREREKKRGSVRKPR